MSMPVYHYTSRLILKLNQFGNRKHKIISNQIKIVEMQDDNQEAIVSGVKVIIKNTFYLIFPQYV